MVFKLHIKKDEWTPLIKTFGSRKVQSMLGDVGNKVCHHIKKNLSNEANRQGWSSIANSVKVDRRGNINNVSVIGYGVALDSMKPHYVSLKRGRKITKWARQHSIVRNGKRHLTKTRAGKSYIRSGKRGGITGGAIYVTPHPWISRPVSQGLRNSKRLLRQGMSRLMKEVKSA